MIKGLTIFTGSWVYGRGAVGIACRLWRLPPSWFRNDRSEVAEVMSVGRRFQSLMVRRKKQLNRTGCLVFPWCRRCAPVVMGSPCWQKPVMLMSTNPLLIICSIWSRLWSLRCSRPFHFRLSSSDCTIPGVLAVSEVVAVVPCCSTLCLFKHLGVFLTVGVPDSCCILGSSVGRTEVT